MNLMEKDSFLKRIIDIALASLLLLITLPIQLFFIAIIYLQSRDNPIYTQMRGLTLSKHTFKIYKLRTLRKSHQHFNSHNIYHKEEYKDSVLPIGKFLRKTGLDELPQLINILKGEMTFIGPRPLSFEDLKIMKEEENHFYKRRNRLNSKPGISGLWQLYGNRNRGSENLIHYDEYYEKNKSLKLDLTLMLFTIPIVFFGNHSDAIVNKSIYYNINKFLINQNNLINKYKISSLTNLIN